MLAIQSVAERTSNFCLVGKLTWPLVSSDIFTQWGWLILFDPDLSRAIQRRWKSANLSLSQNLSSWMDVFLSAPLSTATRHREDGAVWFMDPLGLPFWTQGFPVENELDELIPPLTFQLLHSRTTFSGDLHTSLLQQTGSRVMTVYFISDLPSGSWTFGSILRDPNVPCCKWTRRINSASDNSATSFLDNLQGDSDYFSPTADRTTHLRLNIYSCSNICHVYSDTYSSPAFSCCDSFSAR